MTANWPMRGPVITVVAIALIAFRAFTLGEVHDDQLTQKIQLQLATELGVAVTETLDTLDPDDPQQHSELQTLAHPETIDILKTEVSKPLLSFGSTQKAIVRFSYRTPDGRTQQKYWRFHHSIAGGWLYRRPSSAMLFYLNFL